jgi:hypothetical protein
VSCAIAALGALVFRGFGATSILVQFLVGVPVYAAILLLVRAVASRFGRDNIDDPVATPETVASEPISLAGIQGTFAPVADLAKLLDAHLADANRTTEDAVRFMSGKFTEVDLEASMKMRAFEGKVRTETFFGHSQDLVDESRAVLGKVGSYRSLREREIQEDSDAIENVIALMEKLTPMVELIRAISKQTRVLSLNAAIQAARDSSAGRTFVVVAGEMRQLAQQSETTSKEVNELVGRISGTVKEKLAAMVSKDRLEKDTRWLEVLSNSMGSLMHDFDVAISDLEHLSDYAHSASRKIYDTVLDIQQTAQFQDKSRQQVELVRSGLQDLGTASEKLSRQLDGTFANGEGAPDALFSGILPALESRYTMGSQNETHDRVLRGGTGDSRGLPAIELF